MLETHRIASVLGLDKIKHYAHVSQPRRGVPRSLFDFYGPVGEELPCLIRRLSSQLDAVDDDQGASCLAASGKRLQPFQKRHENHGLAGPGWERDPDLCGTVLERVQTGLKTRLLVGSQLQRAGMSMAEMQDPRDE